MRRSNDLGRTLCLVLLVLLTAVHPLAGAGHASGQSLARWAKELLCVCEHCGAELAPDVLEEAAPAGGCCSMASAAERAPVAPVAPAEPASEALECAQECPCTHPAELPLGGEGPLGAPRDGGADEPGSLLRRIAAGAEQANLAADGPRDPASFRGGHAPPPCATPDARAPANRSRTRAQAAARGSLGARPLLERGPLAFLALLCTALI